VVRGSGHRGAIRVITALQGCHSHYPA